MRSPIFKITCLLGFLCSCNENTGQPVPVNPSSVPDSSAQVVLPLNKDTVITSSKTSAHINIPGTRFYIVPPPGYTMSKKFTGLEKKDMAMIMVTDNVGADYHYKKDNFSKRRFEAEGGKVLEFKELTYNSFEGKFMEVEGDETSASFVMVVGDSTFWTMVMAKCSKDDLSSRKEIRRAILTSFYDVNIKPDLLSAALFKIENNQTKYKFAKSAAGLFIYSIGGTIKDRYEEPHIMISSMPREGYSPKEVAESVIYNMTKYGFEVTSSKVISDPGSPRLDIETRGHIKNEPRNIFISVISDAEKAVVVLCQTPGQLETEIKEFQQFADAVKIK